MSSTELHVVVGAAGATGRRVAAALLAQGFPVRALSRDGRGKPTQGRAQPTWVAADATDLESMTVACSGAAAVYHCAMPPIERWRPDFPVMTDVIIEATARAGARLVYADDTWMYGQVTGPMTPDTPWRPVSPHGVLRAWLAERMLTAAAAGRLPVSIVRAGELYGAGVRSMIADNVFAGVARGRVAHWFGDPDQPITPTLVDDFARTLAAVGVLDSEDSAVWHVPHPATTTGRAFVTEAARQAGRRIRLLSHGRSQLRIAGLVSPLAREGSELVYQFEQPFVVDGSATQARFGVRPTPYADGIAAILAGYLDQREAIPSRSSGQIPNRVVGA